MTARAIVSGSLAKPPAKKTSSNGNAYLFITIRESHGGGSRFWNGFVFNECALAVIEQMKSGEPIAVAGEIEAEIFKPEGKDPRVSLSVKVDGVLNARQPSKQKRDAAPRAQQPAHQTRQREFDDAVPF